MQSKMNSSVRSICVCCYLLECDIFVEFAILMRRHTINIDSEREFFDWDTNSESVHSIVIELRLATNIGPAPLQSNYVNGNER